MVARNQQTKSQLYLIQRIGGQGTNAIAFIQAGIRKNIQFQNQQDHQSAYQDVRLTESTQQFLDNKEKENEFYDIFGDDKDEILLQSCNITQGDQEVILQTQTKDYDQIQQCYVFNTTFVKSISQRHFGSFPLIIYNIGQKKLIIQILIEKDSMKGKQLIYELPENQKFLSFVEYNNFTDIGFPTQGLRIEGCSSCVFLAVDQKQRKIFVNHLLVDPYFVDVQISLFQSQKFFDLKKDKRYNDILIKSIMYYTGKDVKLISQFDNFIGIQEMIEEKLLSSKEQNKTIMTLRTSIMRKTVTMVGDPDNEQQEQSESSEESQNSEDDRNTDITDIKYEKVPMLLTSNGLMFYVTLFDGMCTIKEINPFNDNDHLSVYEIKSTRCLAFSVIDEFLYFMADNKIVNKLQQHKETRIFFEIADFNIKDKDRPNYNIQDYSLLIMNEKYIILESQIFYLYDEIPLENGILDMEQLCEIPDSEIKTKDDGYTQTHQFDLNSQDKSYASGPMSINGSQNFICIFKYGQHLTYKQRIYQLPDSSQISLLQDIKRKVSMSTFIDKNLILVQLEYRFMMFDQTGKFLDSVQFQDNLNQRKLVYKNIPSDKTTKYINSYEKDRTRTYQVRLEMCKKEKQTFTINKFNRMKLYQMSGNCKYFLFDDQIEMRYKIFKLINLAKEQKNDEGEIELNKELESVRLCDDYCFYYQYTVDLLDIPCVKSQQPQAIVLTHDENYHNLGISIEKFQTLVKLLDDGTLIVTYNDHSEENVKDVNIITQGSIFTKNTKNVQHFQEEITFGKNSKQEVHQLIQQEQSILKGKIDAEKKAQARLPQAFKDVQKIHKLNDLLKDLQIKKQNIVQSETFGRSEIKEGQINNNTDEERNNILPLIIVNCGRDIKYATLDSSMFNDELGKGKTFKDVNINFNPGTQICKLLSTAQDTIIQIVAIDVQNETLIVATWDFFKNIEETMMQIKFESGQNPQNYVVKGLNQKRNYYFNQYQIFDLEYNIPLQTSNNSSLEFAECLPKLKQERKIYSDVTRSLSVDNPNTLTFPLSKMDIIFWMNIKDLGSKVKQIEDNFKLSQINQTFDGYSLFQYFCVKVDIIEMIHNKYFEFKQNDMLQPKAANMPLVILFPDQHGYTALDHSIQKQRPKSFELMIGLLDGFNDFCVSKMMLQTFPSMIKQNSDTILKFFDNCIYTPKLMLVPLIISWPDDLDELVFSNHTSIIDEETLNKVIIDTGFVTEDSDSNNSQALGQTVFGQNQLRSQSLPSEDDLQLRKRRVIIEAIDFDWIFETDNPKKLISLLANDVKSDFYIQKSIKTFITLMWNIYRPQIVIWIFFPFLLYMLIFMALVTHSSNGYIFLLAIRSKGLEEEYQQLFEEHNFVFYSRVYLILSGLCFLYLLQYCMMEFLGIGDNLLDYLKDYWNFFDVLTILSNLTFLFSLNSAVYLGIEYDQHFIRRIGAVGLFFLWIKVFYWMRLFKSAAYFLTLITQTVYEIKMFSLMLCIIMFAFSSFFYILNKNTPKGGEEFYLILHPDYEPEYSLSYNYVEEYVGNQIFDALISIYLLSLGEISVDHYVQGPDRKILWFFIFLATFTVLIVFMNMLIAIMGNTFSQIRPLQSQKNLEEQILLISDFEWLLDLNKLFCYKKYIIKVVPDMAENEGNNIEQDISSLENVLAKKNDLLLMSNELEKKITSMEKSNRQMMKAQQTKMQRIHKILLKIQDGYIKMPNQ